MLSAIGQPHLDRMNSAIGGAACASQWTSHTWKSANECLCGCFGVFEPRHIMKAQGINEGHDVFVCKKEVRVLRVSFVFS